MAGDAQTEADRRTALEDAIPLLEAARRRLEALLKATRARRAPSALIREVAVHESELARLLARVERRARAERWPEESPLLQEVRTLQGLRSALVARLAPDANAFAEALERAWLAGLRASGPVRAALRALPTSLPELQPLVGHTRLLEEAAAALEGDDLPRAQVLLDLLAARWDSGERARLGLWKRVDSADPTGDLTRFLGRRGASGLLLPGSGPAQLLATEEARARWARAADRWLHPALDPLAIPDSERPGVLRWILARHLGQDAGPPESVARGELLELVFALNAGAPPAALIALAGRADATGHPDVDKVLERLRVRVAAARVARDPAPPPVHRTSGPLAHRPPCTLQAAVIELAR